MTQMHNLSTFRSEPQNLHQTLKNGHELIKQDFDNSFCTKIAALEPSRSSFLDLKKKKKKIDYTC